MYEDAIVEEVRQARDLYARQLGYSMDAIARDLKDQEAKSGRKYVRLPPKRIKISTGAVPREPQKGQG